MLISIALAAMMGAQPSPGQATIQIVDACSRGVGAEIASPQVPCACAAGLFAGQMPVNEYLVLGQIMPAAVSGQQAMNQTIGNMIASGTSPETLMTVAQKLQNSSNTISTFCGALERPRGVGTQVSMTYTESKSGKGVKATTYPPLAVAAASSRVHASLDKIRAKQGPLGVLAADTSDQLRTALAPHN